MLPEVANARALTSLTRREAPPPPEGREYFAGLGPRCAAALLCAGLLLAGCAGQSPRQPDATSPSPSTSPSASAPPNAATSPRGPAPARPASIGDDPYLRSLYTDPRLDPIRNKVPLLLRPDAIKAAYLTNNASPTLPEKKAIKAWLQIRERAQRYVAEQHGEPSPLLIKTRNRVTEAILQLYSERLSYAEFARRIQQIDAQHQEAMRGRLGPRN